MAVNIGSRYCVQETWGTRGDLAMLLKLTLITIITAAMFLALWKPLIGLVIPPVCLWAYAWMTGFGQISLTVVIVVTAVHLVFQAIAWWYSGKYREAHLAWTGAGITGFATGILAGVFFGAFFGLFIWVGLISRLVTAPVAFGFKTIARSFAGGFLKVVYGTVMSGVLAYIIF